MMDYNLIVISFITVFLSELGDKSQLATIALSGSSQAPLAVFLGTATALVITSFIGVLAGGTVAEFLPTKLLKIIAALGFIFLAIKLLMVGEEGKK